MEQRRILLIIVAVTVVLAVTIGVGLWLFYPRDPGNGEQVADTDGGLEWEPLDYIQGDGSLPGIEDGDADGFTGNDLDDPDADGDFVVTYGVRDEVATGRNGSSDRLQVDEPGPGFSGTIDRTDGTTTRSDTGSSRPATTGAPGSGTSSAGTAGTGSDAGTAGTGTSTTSTGPASGAASAGANGTGTAAGATAPRTASGAPENPASAQPLSDRAYWIQVISSPNRDTVEQARVRLDEYQLGSRILTKEIGETTYYRLRLGPYPIRTEAEKFLDWVSEIDGFTDALIFVDYTTAVLAANTQ